MEEGGSIDEDEGSSIFVAHEQVETNPNSAFGQQTAATGFAKETPVWNYFHYDKEANKCFCLISGCRYLNKGANTTTLGNHLRKHAVEYDEFLQLKRKYDEAKLSKVQPVKRAKFDKFDSAKKHKEKWAATDDRQATLETKLASLFGATGLSHNFITNPFFRDFVQVAEPQFNLPESRTKIRALIRTLHSKTVNLMKEYIADAKKVAISIDLWTQANFKHGYLGVTASFFSSISSKLEVALLGVRQINHPHNAKRIRACTDNILAEYGLFQAKISRILTDGGSNLRKAYKLDEIIFETSVCEEESDDEEQESQLAAVLLGDPNLDASFDEEEILNEIEAEEAAEAELGRVFPLRVDCYAHRLMRSLACVVDRDDQTRELRKNVLRMISKFKSKSTAIQALDALKSKCILLPARTRWNSFSIVIDRLLEIKDDFLKICVEEEIDTIETEDWVALKLLGDMLRPFKRHTDIIQGDQYPTIDKVVPSLLQLQLNLKKMTLPGVFDLPERLHADITSRFSKILSPTTEAFDATFLIATFLSPVLALILDEEKMDCAISHLKTILTEELKGMEQAEPSCDAMTDEPADEDQLSSANSLFPDLMALANAKRKTTRPLQRASARLQAETILSAYVNDLPSIKQCVDSLKFWSAKARKYGRLHDVAIGFLTIPASTATVERVFSVAGDISDLKRNRIRPKYLEMQTMLRFNRKFIP